MSRKRQLSAEDLKLWRHVTRSVSAYHPSVAVSEIPEVPVPRTPAASKTPPAKVSAKGVAPAPLRVGRTADMDQRQARRLTRGDLPVDARIDLHGLNAERAHSALSGFIRNAHGRGHRLVIVITGKGLLGRGRIRSEAPHWLNAADLRPLILAVTEARPHDGGSGALYVLLKRQRPQE